MSVSQWREKTLAGSTKRRDWEGERRGRRAGWTSKGRCTKGMEKGKRVEDERVEGEGNVCVNSF